MSKGLTITLVAATLVLTVAVAGIGAYVFLFQPTAAAEGTAHTEEPAEDAHAEAFYLQPASFLTNLADKDRLRYIDVSIALALKDEAALESAKEIEPQLGDVVLDHWRQKRGAAFAGAGGQAQRGEALPPLGRGRLPVAPTATYRRPRIRGPVPGGRPRRPRGHGHRDDPDRDGEPADGRPRRRPAAPRPPRSGPAGPARSRRRARRRARARRRPPRWRGDRRRR